MNAEAIPGKVLTIGAAFITGFVVASWTLPALNQKPRVSSQDPGIYLVLPARDFTTPGRIASMKGQLVQLIRKSTADLDGPCMINHKPARLQTSDQNIFLELGLDGLESLALNLLPSDLKQPDVEDIKATTRTRSCAVHPRISYGS